MSQYKIPFNKPAEVGREQENICQALANGHISGSGPFTQKCQSTLEQALGVGRALLTTSCTHALEMTALLLDIRPGDEVIVPPFTFVSTVNAFVLRGARPVFVDIRPDTLNLNESLLESRISERTRAIVVVHYAGVACEMDSILTIAARYRLPVIEDNAHGLFARYKDRFLGTFGTLASQSFHETKNFSCGEGGALLINDPSYIERAEIIREKGTNRSRFFRGLVDKYTWVDIGSSYVLSDLLAAYLFAQLEQREKIQEKRRWIWETYHQKLQGWAQDRQVRLPIIPEGCEQSYHMYYLLLPSADKRQELMDILKQQGILAVFHYQPLHLSEMGLAFGGRQGDCPVTETVSDRLLRLPFYYDLEPEDIERIVQAAQTLR